MTMNADALDARTLDTRSFDGAELWLLPFLACLPDLANSVDESDSETRGSIRGNWWREHPNPFDARVQELSLVLAWFYTHERPWNPYYLDDELGRRLALSLDRYLALQHADGAWPEYAAQQHSRSATGFALETLSRVLGYLREVRMLAEQQSTIGAALRRAMRWYFDPNNLQVWWPGYVPIANQPTGAIAGALHALELDPDPALGDPTLSDLVDERLSYLLEFGQSPAGFFHESIGHDLQYSFSVMLPRLAEIAQRTGRADVVRSVSRFVDWYSYNAVIEPDGSGYFLNAASSARTTQPFHSLAPSSTRPAFAVSTLAASVPALRAFLPSQEALAQNRSALADELRAAGEQKRIASPHLVIDVESGIRYPTEAERAAATRALPYLARRSFTEHRHDPREQHYLYVRRDGYYAAAHFGIRADAKVRGGLGLLWHPRLGTVVQGLNASDELSWSTLFAGGSSAAADDSFLQGFTSESDGDSLPPDGLPQDSSFGLRYSDGPNRHQTTLLFEENSIVKTVFSDSLLAEQLPLVLRDDDELRTGDDALTIANPAGTVTIAWSGATVESLAETPHDPVLADPALPRGRRRGVLRLRPVQGPLVVTVTLGD